MGVATVVICKLITIWKVLLTFLGACSFGLFCCSFPMVKGAQPEFKPPTNKAGESAWIELKHQSQGENLCACCSASMVIAYYGGHRNQYAIKCLSLGKQYDPKAKFTDFTPTPFKDLLTGLKTINFNWGHGNYKDNHKGFATGLNALQRSLDDGHPVLVDTSLGKPSHVITVVGYDSSKGEVYCVDPGKAAPGIRVFTYKRFEEIWTSAGFDGSGRNAIFTAKKGKDANVPE